MDFASIITQKMVGITGFKRQGNVPIKMLFSRSKNVIQIRKDKKGVLYLSRNINVNIIIRKLGEIVNFKIKKY